MGHVKLRLGWHHLHISFQASSAPAVLPVLPRQWPSHLHSGAVYFLGSQVSPPEHGLRALTIGASLLSCLSLAALLLWGAWRKGLSCGVGKNCSSPVYLARYQTAQVMRAAHFQLGKHSMGLYQTEWVGAGALAQELLFGSREQEILECEKEIFPLEK